MMHHVSAAYIIILIVSSCSALPKEIKKCHFGNEKCLVDTVNDIIKKYPKGIPEIGLKPIDVVDIQDTKLLSPPRRSTIWADIDLVKQVNYGFENTTITRIKGFGKDPTASPLIISGRIPCLVHKGRFQGQGRLWMVHMNLTGESTSEFQNMFFTLKLKVQMEFRNNKRYLNIYELSPTVKIDRWIIWMDDLFHENTDLTIAVNRVFNSRWIEIWNEWEPIILETFASVFLGMIKKTFDRIPYDEMFLTDTL